jgi:phosphoribosylformylglycinamidine synthase
VHDLVASLVRDLVVRGVHDVSDGGLAIALAEMAIAGEVGCEVELDFEGCTAAEACFAEPASVVLVSVAPEHTDDVLRRAAAAGVAATAVGRAWGSRLAAAGAFEVPLAEATRAWRDAIPDLMRD